MSRPGEGDRPGETGRPDVPLEADAAATQPPADRGTEPPEPRLPEAPLFAMLRAIAAEVGVERVDRVWLFPPRRLKAGESSVAVVAAHLETGDPERRRVLAARYTAPAGAAEPRLGLDEYGTAPADRIGRVVEDVVERIKDAPPEPPRSYAIDRDQKRWDRLLHELAETFLDQATRNPRLPR